MKRIVCLILLLVTTFSLLTSCTKNRKYDEEEVKAAARELIKKSENLNEIFWGEGLDYTDDKNNANGYYYEASFSSLQKYGFSTIKELEDMTRATFSNEYSNIILSTTVSSIVDEDGLQILARYYQKYEDLEGTVPQCIMVYSIANVLLRDKVEYDYESIEVTGSKKETVYVNINCTVTTNDGKKQDKVLNIGLIEEANGWRLDTPTYATYNREYYDKNKED